MLDSKDVNNYTCVPNYAIRLRILVIEEDMTSFTNVVSILQGTSYEVTAIQFPDVALSMVHHNPNKYDLILLCSELQDTNWVVLLDNILSINAQMPIVLMSSNPSIDLIKEALTHGAMLVLNKPIAKHNLINSWQHVIHKRASIYRENERIEAKKRGSLMREGLLQQVRQQLDLTRNDSKEISNKSKRKQMLMGVEIQEGYNATYNNVNGKGNYLKIIESNQNVVKRKRRWENYQQDHDVTRKVRNKKPIVWNDKLHKKFVQALGDANRRDAGTIEPVVLNEGKPQQPIISNHLQEHRSEYSQVTKFYSAPGLYSGAPKNCALQYNIGATQSSTMPINNSHYQTQERTWLENNARNSGFNTSPGLGFASFANMSQGFNAVNHGENRTYPMNLHSLHSTIMGLRNAYDADKKKNEMLQSKETQIPTLAGGFYQFDNKANEIGQMLNYENNFLGGVDDEDYVYRSQMVDEPLYGATSSTQISDDFFSLEELLPEFFNSEAADESKDPK